MTKIFLAALVAIVCYSCLPKMAATNAQSVTATGGSNMLLGLGNKKNLLEKPFADWFVPNHKAYSVDAATIEALKGQLANKQFSIFMGTWCGDSKREVPRLYKVLEACGVPQRQITLVFVNNHDSAYKQSPGHEERGLHIHRVPTLIVRQAGKETGRIVETPVASWEKDLLSIITGAAYTPNYAAAEYLTQQFAQRGPDALLQDSTAVALRLKQLLRSEHELSAYAKMQRTTGNMAAALVTTLLNAQANADKADAWYIAGAYQQMAGNGAAAKTYYQRALALQPGHENATNGLATLNKQ
jgi:thiol-disulfide isomerase/thioredoxin